MSNLSVSSEYRVVGDNTHTAKKVFFHNTYYSSKDHDNTLEDRLKYAALFNLTYIKGKHVNDDKSVEYVYRLVDTSDRKSLTFTMVNVPVVTSDKNAVAMYRTLGITYTKLTFRIDDSDVECYALGSKLTEASECFFEQRRNSNAEVETFERKISIKLDKLIVSNDTGSFVSDSSRAIKTALTCCRYKTICDYASVRQYMILEDQYDEIIAMLIQSHNDSSVACVASGCSKCSSEKKFRSIYAITKNIAIGHGYCTSNGYIVVP